MISVERLNKRFKSGDGQVVAVKDVTFHIPRGSFASIVGKSGSGKSTLLSLLGGLEKPDDGIIMIDNQNVTALSDHDLIGYRCRKIGFVFQNYNLIPNLTALENVMLPMEFAHTPVRKRRERAVKLLNDVGLTGDKQERKPGRLSGGEQQRVAIARALANAPSIVLADEPTGNLDSETGKLIIRLLQRIARESKVTILVVTHDDVLARQTKTVFIMKDGHIKRTT